MIFYWLCAMILAGCEHPDIFDTTGSRPVSEFTARKTENFIVHMKIEGGPKAAVHDLFILNDRSFFIYYNYLSIYYMKLIMIFKIKLIESITSTNKFNKYSLT